MMDKYAPMLRIVAGSLMATLGACADHDTTSDDLLDTEATIAELRNSGAAASAEAQACFDAYKTCQASAAAGDTTCRDQLKACLPERAPRGGQCGGDGGTAPGDAGVVTPPGDAGARIGDKQRDGGAEPSRGDGGGPDRGDGGGGDRGGAGGDRGGPGGGRGGDHGGHGPRGCGGFDGPDRGLSGCREQAGSSMQSGMSADGARAQHQACSAQAFDEILTKLCSKATAACAEPNAPADVCARVSTACAALAKPDAGP